MGLLVPPPRFAPPAVNYSGRPANMWGTTVTPHSTAHLLGANTEIIASTPRAANRLRIGMENTMSSGTNTDTLINFYLGPAGSPVVLIPNLLAGWRPAAVNADTSQSWTFPVHIPRGSRLSAAAQGAQGMFRAVGVQVELWWEDGWAGSRVETLGAMTASSRGTDVTPGTTAEGAWTAIGTTTRRWRVAMLDVSGNSDTSLAPERVAGDIGSADAPVPGLENFEHYSHHDERWHRGSERSRPCDIAPGTALQARLQGSAGDVKPKTVTLHGVY